MIMKTIIIDSERQKLYAQNLIKEMPLDGSCEVITKKVDKKLTTKQRALWFVWCRDVSLSGLGSNDTVADVHEAEKWRIIRPILLRDDEIFGIVYQAFMNVVKGSLAYSESCKIFTRDYISTERLNKNQRGESLSEFEKLWVNKGVNLSIPDDFDRKLLRHKPEATK